MTYEEFKKKIEDIVQYETWYEDICGDEITLAYLDGLLARFNLKDERSYVIYYTNLKSLVDLDDDKIYKNIKELVEELVETPVKEREREQKYYIKLKLPDIIDDSDRFVDEHTFLSVATNTKTGYVEYTLSDRFRVIRPNVDWKIQFTNQEFEEIMPNEYRGSFELIPVEEEE